MSTYIVQPSPKTDQICEDGTELTQLPYPFHVTEDGEVINLATIERIVGFAKDLAVSQVDLWWRDAIKDPQQAVGMYVVTEDRTHVMAVHLTAVMRVEQR